MAGRCQREAGGNDGSTGDAILPPDAAVLDAFVEKGTTLEAAEPVLSDVILPEKSADVAATESRPEASQDAAACVDGQERSCYTGGAGTSGVGNCRTGIQVCERGQWSEGCKGQNLPVAELCNGVDDDCDGKIDNGVVAKTCYEGSPPTSFGIGLCKSGTSRCDSGKWSPCMGQVLPAKEICDNQDNNCDGIVDENCQCKTGATQECGSSVGTCELGKQLCDANGRWGACTGESGPKPEVCDGKDNNCNGQIDESDPDVGQPCAVAGAKGECAIGEWICSAGNLRCQSGNPPKAEVCDGKDNDCDGSIDEGLSLSDCIIPGQVGACAKGRLSCQQGSTICVPQNANQPEVCNGLDDNCNGQIDETFSCIQGERKCSSGGGTVLVCNSSCSGFTQSLACNSKDRMCHNGVCLRCSCSRGADFCDRSQAPNTIYTCTISARDLCEPVAKSVCPAGQLCTVGTVSGPTCQ